MIVRPLAPGDTGRWAEMRGLLWPGDTDHEAELRTLQSGRVPAIVLVAEKGEALVGFAEVTIRSVVDGVDFEPAGYLEGIWVDPGERRKGVGRALLDAAMAWVRSKGCTAMGSDALIHNTVSQAWHRAAGFAEVDRVVVYNRRIGEQE